MEERKLATIRKIKEIVPIEGADNIECVVVDGWRCVSKKNEFHINSPCIYIEIDSILPDMKVFEFLRKYNFRIKTQKLRGQVSQGICFPLSILNEFDSIEFMPIEVGTYDNTKGMLEPDVFGHIDIKNSNEKISLKIGTDLTEILNVKKYEAPIPAQLAGKVKGNFPSFIHKTDEERIQNIDWENWFYPTYKDVEFYVSEKIDGSSSTIYYNNGVFGVCSRNLDLIETEDNTFWKTTRQLNIEESLKMHNMNIALQGELIGEGVQKNKYGLKGHTILFYNVFDIDNHKYLNYDRFTEKIFQLGLKTVPIVSHITGFKLLPTVKEMLEFAEGKSLLNANVEREGIVIRPIEEIFYPRFGRISFKIISNKYLLKGGDE